MKAFTQKKTYSFAISVLKIREFNTLKACMRRWIQKKKCRANVTIFREAKRCINLCNLEWLKTHWEPKENEKWFADNILRGKTLPRKKHRILYEWVEDEIEEFGFILATEVRKEAGVLLGEDFGKYKKFARLSENLKKFFNLKVVTINGSGRRVKWISKN